MSFVFSCHSLACKQKRGPGFKYASNLPGSLLREQKAGRDGREEGDQTSTGAASIKRKSEREETPRLKTEDLPSRLPPLLTPSGLPRPRSEVPNFLRKKRKLFDDDEEEEEASAKKKVTFIQTRVIFINKSAVVFHLLTLLKYFLAEETLEARRAFDSQTLSHENRRGGRQL